MRFLPLALIPLVALTGCNAVRAPVVDMTGVDVGQHSRDLAACEAERMQTSFSVGNPLTNCMERRGYKILVRN